MANVSRSICYVMATLHVKMNQTKTIVNALPVSFAARRGEDASWQQLCATKKTIALTERTKRIAVSRLFFCKGLGFALEHDGKTQDCKFLYSPPARGSYMAVTLIGNTVTAFTAYL